jgi:hypothetical protein
VFVPLVGGGKGMTDSRMRVRDSLAECRGHARDMNRGQHPDANDKPTIVARSLWASGNGHSVAVALLFVMLSEALVPADSDVSQLPQEVPSPALDGATAWLNSRPLTPASLRGKVVVVDCWT